MNKIFLLLLLVACGVQAQIGGSPTGFNYGIKLPNATHEGDTITNATRIPIFNDDNVLNYYADLGDLGDLVGVPRDSLIVQDPNSFGTLYTYWIGTEAQMDALILIDPNYFDNVLWFCTDCTEVVEVDWGNINGDIDNQADLIARLDLKLNASSYTAADVLTKLLTVDGGSSGIDVQFLNGIESGSFLRSDVESSKTAGNLVFPNSSGFEHAIKFRHDHYISTHSGTDDYLTFYPNRAFGGVKIRSHDNAASLRNDFVFDTSTSSFTALGAGEFGGTVSGDDPVNNDDFVTKGYGDANYGGTPYLKYVALITQSGTSAPTAIVLENTLGGTVVWTRTTTGVYRATLASAFTINKTAVFATTGVPANGAVINEVRFYRVNADYIALETRGNNAYVDSNIANLTVEIRVYP